ncbi:unnamed protein product [Prorocentrum cordatum]|uniref:Hexosyltransferase n=1 Tax=Prorocentrum cordatum TaxID=2364126 RepID=A0ABN9YES1_9DINO|nr:unnamed protein product [Polarella glacialis]
MQFDHLQSRPKRGAMVEALWSEMAGAGAGAAPGPRGAPPLGAWAPWRLRAAGAGALQAAPGTERRGSVQAGASQAALLGAGLARDNRAAAYAAEALERWSALSTCLAGGRLGRGVAAASELLSRPELTSTGRRVEAYVTHLTDDDDYLLGASVLAASLAATGTTRPLLAMVTEGVSAEGRALLHETGWAILDVDLVGIEGKDSRLFCFASFPVKDSQHVRGYFCKILLWSLPCHSVIYLDTDTIVMESLDGLFAAAGGDELAAVPDSQPHMSGDMVVQAGLMVVEPSPGRFADLWDVCCGDRRPDSLDSWKDHEQGFLTEYFDGHRGAGARGPGGPRPQWRLLPARYNFNVRYHLRPLYSGITPATASLVHFACCKPWDPKQRHYASPVYVQLFLEFARALGLPWRPSNCAMDELREQEQQRRVERYLAEQRGRP